MSIARIMQQAAAGVSRGNPWDVSEAVYNGTPVNWFFVGDEFSTPEGIFFKSDGTKMYVSGGASGDKVNEYSLSIAWDISSSSYLQTFSVTTEDTAPQGVFFKPDGTKMYFVGSDNDAVYEYDLSTAWDVSSSSFLQSFSVAAQETTPRDLFFKPDGTKMYVVGSVGDDINEYTLSTAWDVSTASYSQNFSVSAQEGNPESVFFKADGTKMYVVGPASDNAHEYDLSTAWDISSASFLQTFSLPFISDNPSGIFFKDDGTKMYIVGTNSDAVFSYDLSTAWDISSASAVYPTTDYFSVAAQETNPEGLFFKPDGLKMYIVGSNGDEVNEYDLSTAWQISTASYLQNFSVATQDTAPNGVFFKPDGTKMYVSGTSSDNVHEYDLSTAWDVSSAVHLQSFSVSAQDTGPQAVSFKPDGTKMYVVGNTNDAVFEYDLSTAWDVSSASFLQSFTLINFGAIPQNGGVYFKPDGLKMYVAVSTSTLEAIEEYDLSTAWDISSASYLQKLNVLPQVLDVPQGVFFRDNGSKMFVLDSVRDAIYAYDL